MAVVGLPVACVGAGFAALVVVGAGVGFAFRVVVVVVVVPGARVAGGGGGGTLGAVVLGAGVVAVVGGRVIVVVVVVGTGGGGGGGTPRTGDVATLVLGGRVATGGGPAGAPPNVPALKPGGSVGEVVVNAAPGVPGAPLTGGTVVWPVLK